VRNRPSNISFLVLFYSFHSCSSNEVSNIPKIKDIGPTTLVSGRNVKDSASRLHLERLSKGLNKVRYAVTLTLKGNRHIFHVGHVPLELKHSEKSILRKLDECCYHHFIIPRIFCHRKLVSRQSSVWSQTWSETRKRKTNKHQQFYWMIVALMTMFCVKP
jgi:hypothetical protein